MQPITMLAIKAASTVTSLYEKRGVTAQELKPFFEFCDFLIKSSQTDEKCKENLEALWALHALKKERSVRVTSENFIQDSTSEQDSSPSKKCPKSGGKKIRFLRKKKGLSAQNTMNLVREVAEQSNIEVPQGADWLYALETGRVKLNPLYAPFLAQVLGVAVEELLE